MDNHAIAEIAGRDSVAAAVVATQERGFERLLPTIALTGTETGDFDAPLRAVGTLKAILGESVEIMEPVVVQDQQLWSAMNSRFAAATQERFGIYSPCLACHLYMHLLRVPVSWELNRAPVIAGERDTHDGRIKLSQTTKSIDAAARILDYAGVELIQPVRGMVNAEIADLVGSDWVEGEGQLGCVLSGNYVAPDGGVCYDEVAYDAYLAGFFDPVGRAVVDAWRTQEKGGGTPVPDFEQIVGSALPESTA
jgi:hypothetical protein